MESNGIDEKIPNIHLKLLILPTRASQLTLVVKNPPVSAGDIKDAGSIPGLRRSPGEGHGNPLQYSCLERGAWRATVLRVTELTMTEVTLAHTHLPPIERAWDVCKCFLLPHHSFFLRNMCKTQPRITLGLQTVGFQPVIRKKNLAFELHGLSPFWKDAYLQNQIWNKEYD